MMELLLAGVTLQDSSRLPIIESSSLLNMPREHTILFTTYRYTISLLELLECFLSSSQRCCHFRVVTLNGLCLKVTFIESADIVATHPSSSEQPNPQLQRH